MFWQKIVCFIFFTVISPLKICPYKKLPLFPEEFAKELRSLSISEQYLILELVFEANAIRQGKSIPLDRKNCYSLLRSVLLHEAKNHIDGNKFQPEQITDPNCIIRIACNSLFSINVKKLTPNQRQFLENELTVFIIKHDFLITRLVTYCQLPSSNPENRISGDGISDSHDAAEEDTLEEDKQNGIILGPPIPHIQWLHPEDHRDS